MPELDTPLLHFGEQYFERIWGGHRLREQFGKPAPPDKPVGEAWLISDHAGDESAVDEGPLAGKSIRELVEKHERAMLGSHASLTVHGRFPLLLKLLDSADHLSVQVHPDDETAQRLGEPDVGKTEMWYVFHAEPDSELICGLDPSVTPDTFADAVESGSVEDLMTRFPVEPGDAAFVSAGTVHAIGGGIVLAEIQQNSDLTYRIYDWGRVQSNGQPRELHVEKAKEAVHFGSSHRGKAAPLAYSSGDAEVSVLAACKYFAAEHVRLNGTCHRDNAGRSFRIVLAQNGKVTVEAGNGHRVLAPGEAVLVPGEQAVVSLAGAGECLLYYVPDLAQEVVAPLVSAGHDADRIVRLGGDPAYSDLSGLA